MNHRRKRKRSEEGRGVRRARINRVGSKQRTVRGEAETGGGSNGQAYVKEEKSRYYGKKTVRGTMERSGGALRDCTRGVVIACVVGGAGNTGTGGQG